MLCTKALSKWRWTQSWSCWLTNGARSNTGSKPFAHPAGGLQVSFEMAQVSPSCDDSDGSCATLYSTVGTSEIDRMHALPRIEQE
jgi:hypothetical protein